MATATMARWTTTARARAPARARARAVRAVVGRRAGRAGAARPRAGAASPTTRAKRDGTEEQGATASSSTSRASMEAARGRARVRDGRVDGRGAALDDYRARWDVPWDGGTVTVGILGWSVAFVGVAALAGPVALSVLGVDPASMSVTERAEYLLGVQVAETATSLGLVYALLSPYAETIQEEGNDWFKIDFSEPFERERGWAKYGLIGYATTFLALAATGFALDFFERASGGQQAVEAAAKQAGTIDGVLPLIQGDSGTMIAVLTVTSVLAPLLEEVVFRGFLLASLTKWLPTPGAVLFSSVLFACAHLAPRDFVELTVLGMVLGFSYARTRNLLTPMLIHSLWNSGVLVVLAIAIKLDVAHELGVPGF